MSKRQKNIKTTSEYYSVENMENHPQKDNSVLIDNVDVPTHKHWSEWLADKVIEEKEEPFVITGGMTTSGPLHFGTLCEFLFPDTIRKALERRGKKCEYLFIADIYDAFDSVPLAMEQYKAQLEPHLGKPLCDVPDPTGKSRSFGDHYLDEARDLVRLFGFECRIIRVNEEYTAGKFDDYARFYLAHEVETKMIVEESSGKQEKKDWSPIMPICAQCGRVSTTRTLSHVREGNDVRYEYVCDKDVRYTKGCGFKDSNLIGDHRYKLVWRLDWPTRKQILGTSIEGAGVDHHTKGGSEDTCQAITKELLKKPFHIPYKYGFILYQGKKYSKSKGTGMGISDIVKLLPPEIVRYMLIRPDLEENVDIDPTPEKLLKTIEEFESASKLDTNTPEISRSDRKKAIAFSLSVDGNTRWSAQFLDVLLYYQIYNDWNEVVKVTGDKIGIEYLRPYVEEWIKRNFIPDDYNFRYQPKPAEGTVKEFLTSLTGSMDALAIHNAIFEYAKSHDIVSKEMFRLLYQALLGKDKGPRLGKLIAALGVDKVKKDTCST